MHLPMPLMASGVKVMTEPQSVKNNDLLAPNRNSSRDLSLTNRQIVVCHYFKPNMILKNPVSHFNDHSDYKVKF